MKQGLVIAALLAATAAEAAPVRYEVRADFPAGSPVASARMVFELEFDFAEETPCQTTGLTVISADPPLGSAAGYSYDPVTGLLILGQCKLGANAVASGSGDWLVSINRAAVAPRLGHMTITVPGTPGAWTAPQGKRGLYRY